MKDILPYVIIAVSVAFTLLSFFTLEQSRPQNILETATGNAVQEGTVSVCVNTPAFINHSCTFTAQVGVQYSCDFDAYLNVNESATFYDDTALFDINSVTGLVQFTPLAGDVGIYVINITAVDNSSCSNAANSTFITLNITSGIVEQSVGLIITKDGLHGAFLNWSAIGNADFYNIYHTSSVDSMRNFNFSDMVNVSGVTDPYWNDTTAYTVPQRFYRIGIINGTTENISAEITGKFDLEFIANNDGTLGRNLFSIPFNATYYVQPFIQEMCGLQATITALDRSDASYENYRSHSCASGSFNNFSLEFSKGFFVYVNTSYNYTVVGELMQHNITLEFISNPDGSLGRNLFGLHFPLSRQYVDPFITDPLCDRAATVTRLNRQDASFENYESHSCASGSFNNYSLLPGQGFFMYLNSSYNYTVP